MRDKITEQRIAFLHPSIRQDVTDAINEAEAGFRADMAIRIVQGLRSIEEQNALYAQGRNGDTRPKVTNAKGGNSYHNYGLAADFAILYDKDMNGQYEELSWNTAKDYDKDGVIDWQEVVAAFKKRGFKWGGNFRTFKDYPHVEKSFGHSPSDLLAKWRGKNLIPGTQYVKL